MTTTESIIALRYMADGMRPHDPNTLWLISNLIEAIAGDAARLNWLEDALISIEAWNQDDPNGNPTRRFYQCSNVGLEKARHTIREAIDAGMETANEPAPEQ